MHAEEIRNICVVGSGSMGHQIAMAPPHAVLAGTLGRKTGKGWYEYKQPEGTKS